MIADYDKVGPFVNDGPPAIDATALDTIEAGIDTVTNEAQRLAGDPAAPNTPIDFEGSLRSGAWTILGSDGAFLSSLEYMLGYLGAGVYFDGTNFQVPGGAQGNGWAVLGVHASGDIYLYSDASTGTASRSYTPSQFLAKRVTAIGAVDPSDIGQEGAAVGQTLLWDASGAWVPGDVPTRWTTVIEGATTLGPSAAGPSDIFGSLVTLPANTLEEGKTLIVRAMGRILNDSGSARTFTFAPQLGGVALFNSDVSFSLANNANSARWALVLESTAVDPDTVESSLVFHIIAGGASSANSYVSQDSSVAALDFTSALALVMNVTQVSHVSINTSRKAISAEVF